MKLLVIDGNSIVNRAYYGIRALNAPDGTPTNGVYGFLTILQKLLADEKPEELCVCFDLKAPTFRHLQYEGYKAQRKGMPEELAVQMPLLKEVLDAMGVRRYELEGWEADDLIGTIAEKCAASGADCRIVTGDKDSFQLITDKTHVLHVKTRMGQTETIEYDTARFEAEYGFEPKRMIDLKALMGDASDNIPGVAGIGEKTALDLLHKYGSVENIYADLDALDVKDGVRKKLREGEESAKMSFDLATIRTNAPLAFAPEDAAFTAAYGGKLYDVFHRLGFYKLSEKWGLAPDGDAPAAPTDRAALRVFEAESIADAEEMLLSDVLAVCSADGLDAVEICDGRAVCTVRWAAVGDGYNDFLKKLFSAEVRKIGYNVKDLMGLLLAEGLPTEGFAFDAAIAAYLLEPTESSYELRRLTARYAGYEAEGAEAVYALYAPLREKLCANGLMKLHDEMELPLCAVLADMERAGFTVDKKALHDFGESLSGTIDALQEQIWALAGEEFNINSPKQLGSVLFEKLMLPAGKKTRTGWSTNADVLEKLKGKHEIVDAVLDYRQLTKLKSTYAEGLLKVIGSDGRIHTSFQMTVTATGRLSSTEPNLQNIPVRTPIGRELRKMFVAAPGCVLVDADYSQIELRLLAHISGDETMRNAFLSGEDIHAVTASQVFGVPLGEVTSLQRSRAKAVNFGIVYGISAFSLAQDIGVFQNEARAYIDAYLEKYHGVRDYMGRIVEQAKADGYVTTLYGRRRDLPELKSSNFNLRSFGERVALNMPIQGTAADIMKLAMLRAHRALKDSGLHAKLLLQVHDELIAECPEAEAAQVQAILTEAMEGAAQLSVPLTAEAHSGRSWDDAK